MTSIATAAQRLAVVRTDIEVLLTVALDDCTDATATVISRHAGVEHLTIAERCVGAARRFGVEHAITVLNSTGRRDPARVLVVNTDADCVVPSEWLVELVSLASNADLVQGGVRPDPTELAPEVLARWWATHPVGCGSLHGANLAVRLEAYLEAGGFPEVHVQEDLLLVRALLARGATVARGTRVMTSGRREGRVTGGFATYLRSLERELAGPAIDSDVVDAERVCS